MTIEENAQKFESPYYTALGHLLAGLTGDESKSKWNLFDSYLTNLELILYHSEGLSLPAKSSPQLDFLNIRLRRSLDFITGFLNYWCSMENHIMYF
jgi:hypothetical protein